MSLIKRLPSPLAGFPAALHGTAVSAHVPPRTNTGALRSFGGLEHWRFERGILEVESKLRQHKKIGEFVHEVIIDRACHILLVQGDALTILLKAKSIPISSLLAVPVKVSTLGSGLLQDDTHLSSAELSLPLRSVCVRA